jgi:hypothetical protein
MPRSQSSLIGVTSANIVDGQVKGSDASASVKSKSVAIRLGALSGSDDFFVMVAPTGTYNIIKMSVVSDTSTTGSDGSNKWEFKVVNRTQSDATVGQLSTVSSELSADTPSSITIDTAQDDMTADDLYELQVVKTGTPTDLSSAELSFIMIYEATD